MEINWFPGHMAKATREIDNYLGVCDCVLYVLDSRAVRSCFNPEFDKRLRLPTVYVLNKCDLVDKSVTDRWAEKLRNEKTAAVAADSSASSSAKKLRSAIFSACTEVLEKQNRRGLNSRLRAMVIGVPNTGKSTLVNCLCGKARLDTGDRAGVTRTARWARVDETLDILDTPGTLYPKITDRRIGENLAIIGSIKDEVIDRSELAVAFISRLNAIDPNILTARFGAEIDGVGGLEVIAKKRGFLLRGGIYDTERAASALLDDYRKGRLGRIALEVV